MSSRNMSLLPWATLHSDSEQLPYAITVNKLLTNQQARYAPDRLPVWLNFLPISNNLFYWIWPWMMTLRRQVVSCLWRTCPWSNSRKPPVCVPPRCWCPAACVPPPSRCPVLNSLRVKGTVAWDFWDCFLGCTDLSRPEGEPLVVFKY